MGSSTSRQGFRPSKHTRPKKDLKRTLSSIFFCGSSSSTLRNKMEDDPTENSLDRGNPTKIPRPIKEFALTSGHEHSLTIPKSKNQEFLESSVVVNENTSPETSGTTSFDTRSCYGASTSNQDRVLPHPNSSKGRVDMSFVNIDDDITERITQSALSENEFLEREVSLSHNSSVESIYNDFQETIPSVLGSSVSEREQEQRDETFQHDDMASVSSDNFSRATPEIDTHELRLDARRAIWDAFLRDNGVRHSDSQTFTFSSDDSDSDSDDDDDELVDDSFDVRYLGSRTNNIIERGRSSGSEIWESIRRGGDGDASQLRTHRCASGLHAYSTCVCNSNFRAEDGSSHASLSRIVMLAETLFEVLGEIQRHPLSIPLTRFSRPAPDSVVDSLPVKYYKLKHESEIDIEQCRICLAEYEEGDEIRALPCQHEYHKSCSDKWLKQVHRVCPLCRGDVCVLSSEIPHA